MFQAPGVRNPDGHDPDDAHSPKNRRVEDLGPALRLHLSPAAGLRYQVSPSAACPYLPGSLSFCQH